MRTCLIVCLAALAACDADASGDDDDPSQGSLPRGILAINEVAPRPDDGPDWAELVVRGDDSVDLCDYFVTDSIDRLDHYHHLGGAPPPGDCSPQLVLPGELIVIVADDDSGAPFRLGRGDEFHIVTTEGEAVDSLLYFHDGKKGETLSRIPHAEGLFYYDEATEGQVNAGGEG